MSVGLINDGTNAKEQKNANVIAFKLDGVGPVDNRPASDKLHHFVQKKIK